MGSLADGVAGNFAVVQDDRASMRRRWRAFIVCAVGASLPVMDVTKVYVVAPAISDAFGSNPIVAQLAVGSFLLAFGLALIPAGRFGDLSSRRTTFLVGLLLFTSSSAAVGLATSAEFLIVARIVQGLSAGIVSPQVIGMIQQLFDGDSRARAFGTLGAIFGLASSIAPALGGLMVGLGGDGFGWRLAFLFTVPIGLAVFVISWWAIPHHTEVAAFVRDFDPVGTALLAVSTVALLVPFVFTGRDGGDPLRWLGLPLAAVSAVAFVVWERRYSRRGGIPLIDLALFTGVSYRLGTLVQIGFNIAMPALLLLVSLQVQSGWGYSAFVAGLVAIPPSVAYAVAAYFASRRGIDRVRRTVVLGLTAFLSAALLMGLVGLFVPVPAVLWVMAVVYGLTGAAGGYVIPPNQASSMSDVPPAQGGLAGSIQQVGQRFGIAVGTSVVSSVYIQVSASSGSSLTAFGTCIGMSAVIVMVTLAIAVVDVRRG
jgi:MFS family permease